MTDEEILAAADACGLMLFGLGMDKAKFEFCTLAFAKFVGKIESFKEREACAKLCENMAVEWKDQPEFAQVEIATMMDCALAIRNRGEA